MADVWVVNASPVITLAKAGYLHLIEQLANEVVLPQPVAEEILSGPAEDPARKAVEQGWGRRASVDLIPPAVVEWSLGRGESSVLAWALAHPPCAAVLDDGEARTCARALGVALMGTLGVVLMARRKGRIPEAVPILHALRAAGLRLDDRVIGPALKNATGEDWDG